MKHLLQRSLDLHRTFYCTDNFDNVKAFLGQEADMDHTASIGLHPAASLMNGFATIEDIPIFIRCHISNSSGKLSLQNWKRIQRINTIISLTNSKQVSTW